MKKSTGITRKIDELGRIVLPKELRDTLGLITNASIEIFPEGDSIVLKKYTPSCTICNDFRDELIVLNDIKMCSACKNLLKSRIVQ